MKFSNPSKGVWWIEGVTPSSITEEFESFYQQALNNELTTVNKRLAGVFDGEYYIDGSSAFKNFVKDTISENIEMIKESGTLYNFPVTDSVEFIEQWMNLQGPKDWNPLHSHSGDYSYVFWHKVPFNFEDESRVSPIAKTSQGGPYGDFAFHFVRDNVGESKRLDNGLIPYIDNVLLSVDNKREGHFAIFPAWLPHSVQPFYSSNEFRVSFSGNLEQVKKEITLT